MLKPRCIATVIAAALLGGCGEGVSVPEADEPIVVLAAASLHDVLSELTASFTASSGVSVRVVSGGSNVLATQIIAGAPADLFISAHDDWTAALAQRGVVRAQHPFAGNALVILVPRDDPYGIEEPRDLVAPEVTVVALAGARVPAGQYAERALDAAGVLTPLRERGAIVRGGDARRTVAFVASGAAQAGVGYATDAALDARLTVAYTFPSSSHDPITYQLVELAGAAPSAGALVTYLTSDDARARLAARGYAVADEIAP